MWKSRNKTELMIEVWEKLDCENVGAVEIEAIETAVEAVFGKPAVDSPMKIARLLADEGAELRHNEIMELYVKRASARPHDADLSKLGEIVDFSSAMKTIRTAEDIRRKYKLKGDKEGSRLIREFMIAEKESKLATAKKATVPGDRRLAAHEIAEWLTLWLQSPELFETWIKMRQASPDFVSKFGEM